MRSGERGVTHGLTYLMVSEQDWESISFERQGTVNDVHLGTAGRRRASFTATPMPCDCTYPNSST